MNRHTQTGLTLVELVVTLTVVAILASVAAPSLSSMLSGNRLTAINNQLVSTLNYMRGESVKRVYNVVMCVRNSDGSGCTASSGDNYENGWIVFVDCNANSTPDTASNQCDSNGDGTVDAPELILADTKPNLASDITITGSSGLEQKVSYRPNGNVSKSGSLILNLNGSAQYKITLAANTGRSSSCKVGSSGC